MWFRNQGRASTRELAAYLEGALTGADAQRVESHLVRSLEARKRLQQLSGIRERLIAREPEFERLDLVPALERAIAAGPPSKPMRFRSWFWSASAFAMVSAALLVSLGPRAEFRSKGAVYSAPAHARAGLQLYRELAARTPEPVVDEISRRDGLLFSFTNVGSAPFTHLMVFAVDAASEIRWFYPAHVKEGADPISIPIGLQATRSLLPNVISHAYASGPLTIYALFTREPLRVSDIEAWLAKVRLDPREPPVPDAKLQKFELTVKP